MCEFGDPLEPTLPKIKIQIYWVLIALFNNGGKCIMEHADSYCA